MEAEDVTDDEMKLVKAVRLARLNPSSPVADDVRDFIQEFLSSQESIRETIKEEEEEEAKLSPGCAASLGPGKGNQKHGRPLPERVVLQTNPRLPVFAGPSTKKEDTAYDLWKHEILSLRAEGHDERIIQEAIRRSLRGEAARVSMRLGTNASVKEILHKFDSVYGAVEVSEDILAKFYSAQQETDESVSEWSCRLEDVLNRAVAMGRVKTGEADEMLRRKFYGGLKQELKDVTGQKFERIDELRTAVRQAESERRPSHLLPLRRRHTSVLQTHNQTSPHVSTSLKVCWHP